MATAAACFPFLNPPRSTYVCSQAASFPPRQHQAPLATTSQSLSYQQTPMAFGSSLRSSAIALALVAALALVSLLQPADA